MSDAATDLRLDRLEADMHDVKAVLARLEPLIVRIDATLAHLATRAEVATGIGTLRADVTADIGKLRADLADKPGKAFLVGAGGVLTAVYALGLAVVAAVPVLRALWHLP